MYAPPPCYDFCTLLKLSLGKPYLKILDLSILFVADAHMKNKEQFSFTSSHSILKYGSENHERVIHKQVESGKMRRNDNKEY